MPVYTEGVIRRSLNGFGSEPGVATRVQPLVLQVAARLDGPTSFSSICSLSIYMLVGVFLFSPTCKRLKSYTSF